MRRSSLKVKLSRATEGEEKYEALNIAPPGVLCYNSQVGNLSMKAKKRIYTRYGDEGETALLYGGRVSKTSLHCQAYGDTDEACSVMGLARALSDDPRVKGLLKELQRDLFAVGAELATDPARYDKFLAHFKPVSAQIVERLESTIDDLEDSVELPPSFIIPGASAASSAVDMARCIVRRAERHAVALKEQGRLTNPEILRYLNRLSDLLFVLARYQDRQLPLEKLTSDDTGASR